MKARTFAQRQADKPSPCYKPEGHHKLFIQALGEGRTLSLRCKVPWIVHIDEMPTIDPYAQCPEEG